ncbi:MAG: glutathione S-transferase family protein, partial [Waterburya sp.]
MSNIIVYGINTLRTLRIHWILQELNIAYQTKPIQSRSEAQTSIYKAVNPGQKIPFLQDGELVISESAAICIYLAEKYSNGTLIPTTDATKRARFFQVCFYVMTELDAHTLYIIAKHGGSLIQYYKPSPEAVEVAIAGFNQQILVANSWLKSFNSYILGETFTVADILLCTCLISANKLALKFPL